MVLPGRGILSYFTRHRTAANLVMVLMIVAGVMAAPRMRAQYFPDVIVDSISVSVSWPGAGAEDVDAAIVQVLEPALLAVEGVTGSSANSTGGRANIRLEFEPGADIDRAAEGVQLALDAAGNLPEDAGVPVMRRGGWSDRVTDLVITGPVGPDQLARFADELSARLFAQGVTRVSVLGVAAPSTIVEVPSLALIQYDIGMADIADAIAREVSADPAGDVSGAARVRTGTPKRSAEEIAGIVLRQTADGANLTIGDVAAIRVEGVDRDRAYFVGDNPAIQIRINRSANGDAIGIQQITEDVVREVQATMPEGVSIDVTNSTAGQISGRLALLLDNGLMGLGLVVLLLFLFLNARTAFWVAAGIPVAMFAGVALMYAAGLTFNMISLFALILTLGIVVDDAIVVGEHADYRVRYLHEDPKTAAETAAQRMFSPVFSATITTIIAFLGLMVIGGRFGDLIADIPLTVIAVLVASSVECFLILPHHLSHAIAYNAPDPWYDWPSRQVNRGFAWVVRRLFRPFVALVIKARYPVLAGAIVLLALQAAFFIRGDVQWRFFSQPEQGSVSGNFAMLPGATREDSLAMMREMQRATTELGAEYAAQTGINPLAYVIAEIGGNAGRGLAGSETKESWQLGAISIELVDADLRPFSSSEFVTTLQERIVQHPMAETVSFRSFGGGPGGDSIDIQLYGADLDTLKAAAEALKSELAQFSEVSGIEDSLSYDKEELILSLTPQGQALGFTIDSLGRTLRDRLGGIEAASYPDGLRSATIRVELPASEQTADFLDRTRMRADSGDYVALADIVQVQQRTGFATVGRENGVVLISVTGDLSEDDPDRATEITRAIGADILPRIESTYGVGFNLSGLSEQEQAFLSDALLGLLLCLTAIFLVLAWIFGSWTRPLVVMAVIPFGLIGAVWGHVQWDIPLSLFSVVGLLGMVGIIINDSIVLVTTIDEYAAERGLIPAIIDGVADRLRPVFLTTATTLLGLAPLLFEGSNQAEFLKPTVVTLVYGLGFGMVLVLIVVPALMAMQQDVGKQVRAVQRALRSGRALGLPAGFGVAAAAALFGATILPVLITGNGWPALSTAIPALSGGFVPALGIFAGALAAVLLLTFLIVALVVGLRRPARP